MSGLRFEDDSVRSVSSHSSNRFRLDKGRGKLMGVCSGIADYMGWDPSLVRIGWVVATLAGAGILIPVYFAIGFIAD